MVYQKTQFGFITLAVLGVFSIVLVLTNSIRDLSADPIVLWIILSVQLLLFLLFYSLTVTIRSNVIELKYGIGLIHKKFEFDKIDGTKIITTPWYYGWGLRITPQGMLYNISGSKAVKVKYVKNGKSEIISIGSAEPKQLKKALDRFS